MKAQMIERAVIDADALATMSVLSVDELAGIHGGAAVGLRQIARDPFR
jgi:hypothetical protein